MQHTTKQGRLYIGRTASIAMAFAALACSGEATPPTAATNLNAGTPPAGVVANVVVGSHQVALKQGYYAQLTAVAYDGSGAAVSGKKPVWTSSNAGVVIASDSGVVYGKAVGTATVYGTVDGHVDSASVVVSANSPPATPDSTTHTPSDTATHTTQGAVASFNLTVNVVAPVTGTDTTNSSPLPGVSVALTRTTGIHGDTLNPAVLVATLVTDASGNATMANVPGGYYHIVATPPAGYVAKSFGILAPTIANVQMKIILAKAP